VTEILVVDDSLTVRMDLAEALEAAGLAAVPCANLAEARAALADRAIALAILDVRLPDGDGIEFLGELRADPRYAQLPVLMLSSEAEVGDRIHGLRMVANEYVVKPYDTDSVIVRVRELVGSGRTSSANLVLVIDDSLTFRSSLAAGLERAGYTVIAAGSGAEGLRMAAARRPAAIIVDGVMPEMNGDTVIRRVRLDPALRTTPCLLLTGSDDATAEIHALDAGADLFVRKEADLDMILARVGALLRSSAEEVQAETASLLGPTRILAVDDSPTYLHAIADQLHDEGFDVVQAMSGEEAIELLAVQHVDCILLDLVMPGLSGIDTCRQIKAAPSVRDTPLIVLTSHDSRDAMIDGLAAGADDFVSKSSGREVLSARIQAQIRRRKFDDEHRHFRTRLLRSEREAAEARAAQELAETRAALAEQLEQTNAELSAANRELEAFSYSVSHDLRAPLRAINGFATALVEDLDTRLDDKDRAHFQRVFAATLRMGELIDSLLELSRIGRVALEREPIDVSAIASAVALELEQREPARSVEVVIAPGLVASADRRLVRSVFDNLLGNAWKFTARAPHPRIEVARDARGLFVRDNGIGFDSAGAERLFRPFQRFHAEAEFPGTGIGLATVRRIVERHRGRVWAESAVGAGATFYFTLPAD
jgi:DNA-binding response OmpR family regulator